MNENIVFCQSLLRRARDEAHKLGIKLPTGLTALRCVSSKNWWLVESRDGYRKEICADNAYEARYKAIAELVSKHPREA